MASAQCTVQDGSSTAVAARNGVAVTPGNTVTIALIDPSSVTRWFLQAVWTNGTISVAAFNAASLTVNQAPAWTATFVAPPNGVGFELYSEVYTGPLPAPDHARPDDALLGYGLQSSFGVFSVSQGGQSIAFPDNRGDRVATMQIASRLSQAGGTGVAGTSQTIANLDTAYGHVPATVRYESRGYPQALGTGASETAAWYCRLDHSSLGNNPIYGLYFEVDSLQNFASGGAATKVVHRGHGDAHYVALLNGIDAATITAMTGNGVSPIVCTVPNHGFGQGDVVTVSGSTGNTAANGTWYGITVIDANTFSLPGSTGNGAYTASSGSAQDIDPPVGYEGAAWGDGTTAFLASVQRPGGIANWTGFNALVQANALLNYAAFNGNEVPNNCFSVNKRIGMADSALDGYAQYSLLDANVRMLGGNGVSSGNYRGGWSATNAYAVNDTVVLSSKAYACTTAHTNQRPPNASYWTDVTDAPNFNRRRWVVFNNGEMDQQSLLASAATTTIDSPIHRLNASYWNGSAGAVRTAYFVHHMVATTPQSDFRLLMGAVGAETTKLIVDGAAPLWYRTGAQGSANTQGGTSYDEIAYVRTTNAAASSVDTAYKPPAGHSATVRVQWNVRDASTSNTAGAETIAVVRNVGGTLTVAGAGAATSVFGDAAVNTSAIGFTVSAGNTLQVQGTPPAGYSGTLDWQFRLEIVEN